MSHPFVNIQEVMMNPMDKLREKLDEADTKYADALGDLPDEINSVEEISDTDVENMHKMQEACKETTEIIDEFLEVAGKK